MPNPPSSAAPSSAASSSAPRATAPDDARGRAAWASGRLVDDGILRVVDGHLRTTRRWQAAMMRAAARALAAGEADGDLRPLVASALLELERDRLDTPELVALVLFLLPIEAGELLPALRAP